MSHSWQSHPDRRPQSTDHWRSKRHRGRTWQRGPSLQLLEQQASKCKCQFKANSEIKRLQCGLRTKPALAEAREIALLALAARLCGICTRAMKVSTGTDLCYALTY
jgi:hypothetical protein